MPTDEQPQGLCLDRGYDYDVTRESVIAQRFVPHIRARGEDTKAGFAIRLEVQAVGRRGLPLVAEPQPRDPHQMVKEGREPPRPAPARQRPDRLQESPRRHTSAHLLR